MVEREHHVYGRESIMYTKATDILRAYVFKYKHTQVTIGLTILQVNSVHSVIHSRRTMERTSSK